MNTEFHRIKRLPPYVFAEVNATKAKMRASGADIIDLGMGNPDLPTPQHIVDKLCEVSRDPKAHRYSASQGIKGLRKAFVSYYERRFGVTLDMNKEVCVTLGSKEGLANLASAITNPGDIILGLASPGFHSNGYSLVRRVIEHSGHAYEDPAPFARIGTLAESLLTPTRIYVKSCLAAIRAGHIKALCHITGGGFIDNLPRVLPEGVGADIDAGAIALPPMMKWIAKAGGIESAELARTFNCGVGMVAVVSSDKVDETTELLTNHGESVMRIGIAVTRDSEPRVKMLNLDSWMD